MKRSSRLILTAGGIALSIAIVFLAVLAQFVPRKDPLFDDRLLHKIATAAIGLPLDKMFDNVTNELRAIYGDHIATDTEWMFNCAGGFRTGMLLLHASVTEYVIFWGSAVDTAGMSGRHLGEFHDFLMTGKFYQWHEGSYVAKEHLPGAYIYHPAMGGSIVALEKGTWMLEHMNGFIPFSLPFGLADSFFSTMDWITIYKSIVTYARLTIKELVLYGKF